MIDIEGQERQAEILALAKMMRYAGQIAGDLNVPQALFLIRAAQASLLSTLETEFRILSGADLSGVIGDTHGHC